MLDDCLQIDVALAGVVPPTSWREADPANVFLLPVPEAGGVTEHLTSRDLLQFGRVRVEPVGVVRFRAEIGERRVEVEQPAVAQPHDQMRKRRFAQRCHSKDRLDTDRATTTLTATDAETLAPDNRTALNQRNRHAWDTEPLRGACDAASETALQAVHASTLTKRIGRTASLWHGVTARTCSRYGSSRLR
jgi:hypothetical protein